MGDLTFIGDREMWIGLQELEALVRSFDSKRGVDREIVLTMPIEALLATVTRRETNRLKLARDAASRVIPVGVAALPTPPVEETKTA